MNTQVIVSRPFMGGEIGQQSKTGFLDATAIMRIGNKWRINNNLPSLDLNVWINGKGVQEFKKQLETQFGIVYIPGRGRSHHTWMHPYLFLDLALSLNPQFKIEVYGWIYDQLLKYRNDSGDSWKKMTGALYDKVTNKSQFPKLITKWGYQIKESLSVQDWEHATEEQLKKRDKIHDAVALLSDLLPPEEAVRIAIKKVLDPT